MSFEQRRQSKGISLTISAVLEALFFIGIIAFLYWFFLSRILEIHTATLTADNERRAINFANVLLSYEEIAYINNGKIERGLLDASKLESFASKKGTTSDLTNEGFMSSAWRNYKQISLGYPSSFALVEVTDLENCGERGCVVWVTVLVGPTSNLDLTLKLLACLAVGFPRNVHGCIIATMGETYTYYLSTGSPVATVGLPTLIRYDDGTIHIGRMTVIVLEWR
jgi:hypothetical protein